MAAIKKKKSKSKDKTSLISKLVIVVNLCFICLLLLSYLSIYVSPEKYWLLAFAGLAYPFLLVSNLFFVLFWLVFLKKYFLLSLIAILIGYNQIKTFIKFSGSTGKLFTENSIKVMSYNVRLFDLYNWRNESSRTTRSSIFDLIKNESSDILCLQEYYSGAGKHADFADTICLKAGYKYRSTELINKETRGLPYGLAIFSRNPIIESGKLVFSNSKVNFCQWSDISVGKDTIRVLNVHLESVRFGKEDYNFVSEITTTPASNESIKSSTKVIISKMRYAFVKRASQIETISRFIENSAHPVILCGDFNDTPVSYSYRQIANKLNDSFVDAGSGLGQTHTQMLPLLRIDYIFYSKNMKAIDHRTIQKDYSDHFPVVAQISLPE